MPSAGPEPSEHLHVDGRRGLSVGVLGALMIIAALAFDATPLLVPGIGFLLLGALSPAWLWLSGRSAGVRRTLGEHRVVEDEPLEARLEIRRGPLGLPGAELLDPLAGGPISLAEATALVSGRARVELRIVARVHRRGRHVFPPPALRLSDPLGLTGATRSGRGDGEVLVLPRTEPVRWLRREHRRAVAGQLARTGFEPVGAGEIDGLRQYLPGTPASRIHWPALARMPSPPVLLERRLVSPPRAQTLIVLDARTGEGAADAARLDAAVRAAASLVLAIAPGGGCGVLLPGERTLTHVGSDLAGWPQVHARLALVEAELDPRRGPALREEITTGAVIYVAARLDGRASLPAAAGRVQQLTVVLPLDAPGRPDGPASFEVTGCVGFLTRVRGARVPRRAA